MRIWQTLFRGLVLCGLSAAANAGGITVSPVPNQPYTQYSFTAIATGGESIIIGFRDDPAYDAFDNVSVTGTAGTNLLVNGSFETGDFTGWTPFGNFTNTFVTSSSSPYGPQDGTYYVTFGPVGADGFIYQNIVDTPGETLTLSVWVAGDGSAPSVFCMMSEIEGTSCALPSPPPSVPEPLTLSLFGMGIAGAGLLRRRRKA